MKFDWSNENLLLKISCTILVIVNIVFGQIIINLSSKPKEIDPTPHITLSIPAGIYFSDISLLADTCRIQIKGEGYNTILKPIPGIGPKYVIPDTLRTTKLKYIVAP